MSASVTIALAKGRLEQESCALFERLGMDCAELKNPGRKLMLSDGSGEFSFILVKPSDVPTYVEHGVADIGICGKDTLLEENLGLYELLDLGFGKCRMAVAGYPEGTAPRGNFEGILRVATKYPNIARSFYEARGETIEIIRLNGSVELGPVTGLSDVIVDIVESGSTLRANGLTVLEEICPISARVVVNRVSLKTKRVKIKEFIGRLEAALKGESV